MLIMKSENTCEPFEGVRARCRITGPDPHSRFGGCPQSAGRDVSLFNHGMLGVARTIFDQFDEQKENQT